MTDDAIPDTGDEFDDQFDDVIGSEAAERLKMRFGFDDEQAQMFMLLTGAASLFAADGDPALGEDAERDEAIDLLLTALDDPTIAFAAWDAWAEEGITGDKLQRFVDEIAGPDHCGSQPSDRDHDGTSRPGITWLQSRQALLRLDSDESIRLLDSVRDSGHAAALIDLAGLQADASNPIETRDLLEAAGVNVAIDLDAAYDPLTSERGLGIELAEEIAPFAALRPKAVAGRNDTCPCGSGKKYKHCHLGNELHSLNDRAAWLYLKMMRFMQLTNPFLPDGIVAEMTSSMITSNMAEMLEQSYIPTDIALHEGNVANRFLMAKSAILPADEIELTEQWIAAPRSVFRVKKSTHAELELTELRSRDRISIVGTIPEQPLEVGTLICGRPLPVGQTHRSYGGFVPVDESMIDSLLEACASRNLETVAISLSQIFDAAELADAFAAEDTQSDLPI
ncbi:MAG: SEC-C domain-containing protein [Ilumatobacter sp.]|uniref:YecA family protein n=1 Tax=uncultured Ilumatobacter sp. TaxID=879968 RepID=UPI0035916D0E